MSLILSNVGWSVIASAGSILAVAVACWLASEVFLGARAVVRRLRPARPVPPPAPDYLVWLEEQFAPEPAHDERRQQ